MRLTRRKRRAINNVIAFIISGVITTIFTLNVAIPYQNNRARECMGDWIAFQRQNGYQTQYLHEEENEYEQEIMNDSFEGEDTELTERNDIVQTLDDLMSDERQNFKVPYTEDDLRIVAGVMYAEEDVLFTKLEKEDATRAALLCGSVVINRVKRNYRGATSFEDVVFDASQYDTRTIQKVKEDEIPQQYLDWARDLLENGTFGPENLIYQAEFLQGEKYDVIYNQYFGLLPE